MQPAPSNYAALCSWRPDRSRQRQCDCSSRSPCLAASPMFTSVLPPWKSSASSQRLRRCPRRRRWRWRAPPLPGARAAAPCLLNAPLPRRAGPPCPINVCLSCQLQLCAAGRRFVGGAARRRADHRCGREPGRLLERASATPLFDGSTLQRTSAGRRLPQRRLLQAGGALPPRTCAMSGTLGLLAAGACRGAHAHHAALLAPAIPPPWQAWCAALWGCMKRGQ